MLRNSLYALAASIMTIGAFSSTVAIMTVGSTSAVQQVA